MGVTKEHISFFHKPVPVMVTRKAQVSMATYFPQTKEEFIKLPGCGEKMYDKCGEMITVFIKSYLDVKSKKNGRVKNDLYNYSRGIFFLTKR